MNARFDSDAAEALAAAYPEAPALLRHELCGHELLQLPALAELAGRMRPADVLCCAGDVPVGCDADGAPANGLTALETIATIAGGASWMVLKFVDQDPQYRALVDSLLDALEPAVRPATGRMRQREAFVFVSSPGAVTPFHFDGEHNILLQLSGEKVFTIFPAGDARLAPPEANEAFHLAGRYTLAWSEEFAAFGRPLRLRPGDALYVPVKAPHWVRNGAAPSVSLSITWRSGWSEREERAHRFNHWLRSAGAQPRAPARYPQQNYAKSLAWQAIGRSRRLLGSGV